MEDLISFYLIYCNYFNSRMGSRVFGFCNNRQSNNLLKKSSILITSKKPTMKYYTSLTFLLTIESWFPIERNLIKKTKMKKKWVNFHSLCFKSPHIKNILNIYYWFFLLDCIQTILVCLNFWEIKENLYYK